MANNNEPTRKPKQNIYEKLAQLRVDFQKKGVKKNGKNKYAGFNYFELTDILPVFNELAKEAGVTTVYNFNAEQADLTLFDVATGDSLTFSIAIQGEDTEARLGGDKQSRGMQPVQRLGSVVTYTKRYLYVNLLELSENDLVDAMEQDKEPQKSQTTAPKKESAKPKQEKTAHQTAIEEFGKHYKVLSKNKEKRKPFGKWLSDHNLLDVNNVIVGAEIGKQSTDTLTAWNKELKEF